MKIHCKFTFEYSTKEMADKICEALEVDNYRFIKTEVKNNRLIADIEAKSVMSLLHTAEDYLSCLSTAENVITQTEREVNKI